MTLSPADLGARLDRILACAGGLVASVPMPYLEHRSAGGDRSLGDLAFHLFRSALAFADGMDLGARCPRSGSRRRGRRISRTATPSRATAPW